MKTIGAGGFRGLKSAHLFFVSLWIGGSIGLMCFYRLTAPATEAEVAVKYAFLEIIDYAVVIPGAVGCLLTGAAFSLWTHFGFFKHRWVSLKWILIILQIVFGTFWLGRWLTGNAHMTVEEGTGILGSATFLRSQGMAKTWGLVQVMLLIAVIGISVFKPKLAVFAKRRRNGQFQNLEVVS